MRELACGCKPPWRSAFDCAQAVRQVHPLELQKQTFWVQNGTAADPAVIARLACIDVVPGVLFEQGHWSGWWMLRHILADGDIDNDASRPRDVPPCTRLVYEFVLHIQQAWEGYGWYMGWKIVRLLRSAFGCPALVLPQFPGMSTPNRRAIAALRAKPDEIYTPTELCVHLGLPPRTCVLTLELMICSAWHAYIKCPNFDVASAEFSGREALALWIEQHADLFHPPLPAPNAVWVDAVELLSLFEAHVPRLQKKQSFGEFMLALYRHEWLVRANPLVCPDVQSLMALVQRCRQRIPNQRKPWFAPKEVIAYAVRAALLGSPTRIAAMANAVTAIGPPPHTHCTNNSTSPNCGQNNDICPCCRRDGRQPSAA